MKDILNRTMLNSCVFFLHVLNINKTYLVVSSNECDQRRVGGGIPINAQKLRAKCSIIDIHAATVERVDAAVLKPKKKKKEKKKNTPGAAT